MRLVQESLELNQGCRKLGVEQSFDLGNRWSSWGLFGNCRGRVRRSGCSSVGHRFATTPRNGNVYYHNWKKGPHGWSWTLNGRVWNREGCFERIHKNRKRQSLDVEEVLSRELDCRECVHWVFVKDKEVISVGETVYRSGVFERYVLTGLLFAVFAPAAIYSAASGDWFDGLFFLVIATVPAMIIWPLSLRLGRDTLEVRNIFRRRVIELRHVVSVTPEYEGLNISLESGKNVRSLAIQRHNIALFLRRRTRADAIAEEILRRAERARFEAPGA